MSVKKDLERFDVTKENMPGKCDVRLSKNDMKILQELSESSGRTRSTVMRDALRFFHKWCMEK
jgi:predicted transcriptional regulator